MFLLAAAAAFSQTENSPPADPAVQTQQQPQTEAPAVADQPDPDQQKQDESNRSAIEVKKGSEALKNKDLFEKTGYLHPFVRMPKYLLIDQKAIWTSPFHTAKKDIKYWAIFGGLVGGLIAADKHIEAAAPNNSTLRQIGTDGSYLGQAYSLLPIAAGLYLYGTGKGIEHLRETGLLCFEAVADTTILQLIMKPMFSRARPDVGDGHGHFWDSPSRINASFPSGHSINTFAMASVIAHEYHHHTWVKVLCYSYGVGIAAARLSARQHFPSDVVAGGVIGWFTGDYVYAKRHNPELDNPSPMQSILSHVHIGGTF